MRGGRDPTTCSTIEKDGAVAGEEAAVIVPYRGRGRGGGAIIEVEVAAMVLSLSYRSRWRRRRKKAEGGLVFGVCRV